MNDTQQLLDEAVELIRGLREEITTQSLTSIVRKYYLDDIDEFLKKIDTSPEKPKREMCPKCDSIGYNTVMAHKDEGFVIANHVCAFCKGSGYVSEQQADFVRRGKVLDNIRKANRETKNGNG